MHLQYMASQSLFFDMFRHDNTIFREKIPSLKPFIVQPIRIICIVADNINIPQRHCCGTLNIFMSLTVTCTSTAAAAETHRHAQCNVFLLQNDYANAPQCYILRTLPILLKEIICHPNCTRITSFL